MTSRLASLLCFLLAVSLAKPLWHQLDRYGFEQYERDFNKQYETSFERETRKAIFNNKLAEIIRHNKDSSKTWKSGVNHLTDRTKEEFGSLLGSKPSYRQNVNANANKKYDLEDLEARNVDWRTKGIVTPVKDQGGCGSCWTFATASVVESFYALLTGELSDLSEQQILDCTPNPDKCGGTGGCGGGTAELAMARIMNLGGLATEWTYPYMSYGGGSQSCRFNPSTTPPFANISAFYTLPQNKYAPLLDHISNKGPIAISVDASSWSSYETGVFDGCNQTNPDLDHAVLLVGYGTDDKLGPYWLVRNSWSAAWGEAGYIRIARKNEEARCGEDLTPRDGDGCSDGPPEVKVCGTCGILYDNAYPDVSVPKRN